MLHVHRGGVPIADETEYPLSGLWSRTYRGIDDGALMMYAWDRAVNLMEPFVGHSDGTHTAGL